MKASAGVWAGAAGEREKRSFYGEQAGRGDKAVAIRNAAKAVILRDGKILVNKCRDEETGEIYYDLPGGGQRPFETMEEALVREVMEETGYRVSVVRFAALAEEIYLSEELRAKYCDYCHRILHIFLVQLEENAKQACLETDFQQEASLWIGLESADKLPFRPGSLNGALRKMAGESHPLYLGTVYR